MPHTQPPNIHGVSSLSATPIAYNGLSWLEITAYGPRGEPVRQSIFFEESPTTTAYITALAAAINAVPLVMVAPAAQEAA